MESHVMTRGSLILIDSRRVIVHILSIIPLLSPPIHPFMIHISAVSPFRGNQGPLWSDCGGSRLHTVCDTRPSPGVVPMHQTKVEAG